MWIFSQDGHFSIVAHRTEPELLLVRARHPNHIGALLPNAELTHLPSADYPFRTVARRSDVHEAVKTYLLNLDYDNFKASIDDDEFHEVCLNVWHTMWVYGKRHRNQGGV